MTSATRTQQKQASARVPASAGRGRFGGTPPARPNPRPSRCATARGRLTDCPPVLSAQHREGAPQPRGSRSPSVRREAERRGSGAPRPAPPRRHVFGCRRSRAFLGGGAAPGAGRQGAPRPRAGRGGGEPARPARAAC